MSNAKGNKLTEIQTHIYILKLIDQTVLLSHIPHSVEDRALKAWNIENGVVFLKTDKTVFHFYFLRSTITYLICWNYYSCGVQHDLKLY